MTGDAPPDQVAGIGRAPQDGVLHLHPPVTLTAVQRRLPLLLPTVAVAFVALGVAASADALPWDRAITDAAVAARTPWFDEAALAVSRFGSTPVVLAVSALAALASWRRCPRLAAVIVVVALARPLLEWGVKELVGRERPAGARLVPGRGPSFPSGHPFAAAASWGFAPVVVALYTRRRALWWLSAVAAWVVIVLVAASRVWLGVHWTTDVVAGVLLAVLGVYGAERLIVRVHGEEHACALGGSTRRRRLRDRSSGSPPAPP